MDGSNARGARTGTAPAISLGVVARVKADIAWRSAAYSQTGIRQCRGRRWLGEEFDALTRTPARR